MDRSLRIPLTIGALGVVFGDIGTSPLYAVRECFRGIEGLPVQEENVLGILSLIFWAITIIVSLKYVGILLKADNNGEGGVFALHALLSRADPKRLQRGRWVFFLTLLGASFLFSDGMITPAISVLSAVEGLAVYSHNLAAYVVPLSALILFLLFRVQKLGTGRVSGFFGPVMLLWFLSLGILGFSSLLHNPGVLRALHPVYALRFLELHGLDSLYPLGSVFLAITGAEALYADLGHFGKSAIRRAWFVVAKPALLLNYFGQGAFLLQHPESGNPFYDSVPAPLLIPMIILATSATIIASQALISGAFSLAHQAVQLGYLPRLRILHTSPEMKGQIYIPFINGLLGAGVLLLVFLFQSSSALSHAYGVAISANMVLTTILFFFILRWLWGVPLLLALLPCLALGFSEGIFFLSNSLKFLHGGFVPFLIAFGCILVMDTWKRGRELLRKKIAGTLIELEPFLRYLREQERIPRVRGTAVFLNSLPDRVPPALLHYLKHVPVLPERILLLTIQSENEIPRISSENRIFMCEDLGEGFYRIVALYGFMDTPDVKEILSLVENHYGIPVSLEQASFFLGRETLILSGSAPMPRWRKTLFAFLSRNATPASSYFGIPPGRVVEMGMQIEI